MLGKAAECKSASSQRPKRNLAIHFYSATEFRQPSEETVSFSLLPVTPIPCAGSNGGLALGKIVQGVEVVEDSPY